MKALKTYVCTSDHTVKTFRNIQFKCSGTKNILKIDDCVTWRIQGLSITADLTSPVLLLKALKDLQPPSSLLTELTSFFKLRKQLLHSVSIFILPLVLFP